MLIALLGLNYSIDLYPSFVPKKDEIPERNKAYSNGEKKDRSERSDLALLRIKVCICVNSFTLHGNFIFIWRNRAYSNGEKKDRSKRFDLALLRIRRVYMYQQFYSPWKLHFYLEE
jgi:hypothetical protein